jgi:rubredoxin
MSYSQVGIEAEGNARLLFDLAMQLKARGIGSVCGFFEVGKTWCCPSCHRQKAEIARLDKNGNILCALVLHHDHWGDFAQDKIPFFRGTALTYEEARPYDSLRGSFSRFPETLICQDCNVAEGAAKVAANTENSFSFSPFEISTFIIVANNVAHKVDREKAITAYQKTMPSMALYSANLREVLNYDKKAPESFEQVGGAAWRVLKDVREKMKKNAE